MMLVPHIEFIIAAYGVTAITLGATVTALVLDRRRQERLLVRLTRPSAGDHCP